MKSSIQSLNLLMSYPVNWNAYRILRDFLQNFYDSKGFNHWWQDFHYDYTGSTLSMTMDDSVFSYEWLLHIGASTKTNDPNSAGYFGEGFKIAALCAMRDFGWDISMASKDWNIHVTQQDINIDGTWQKGLAYEISSIHYQNHSTLTLKNICDSQYQLFKTVLLSFYYPENPLLADKLFENENIAVYTRSSIPLPDGLPTTYPFGKRGCVFARFQLLGTLPFDIIIAYHPFEQLDRERNELHDYDVLELFYKVAGQVNADTASFLLTLMRNKWNAYPKQLVDLHSWYYIVCQLIRRVALSSMATTQFKKSNPNLLYTERFYEDDTHRVNRRRQARAWLKTQPIQYKIVMEPFRLLDYPELETLCEKMGGFADNSQVTSRERPYIQLLNELIKLNFSDFFPDTKEIPCRVIRKENAAWVGEAELTHRYKAEATAFGLQPKFYLKTIALKETCFSKDGFSLALSTYLHELCHMFGGDASANFSRALTMVTQLLISNAESIQTFEQKWKEL